MELISTLLLLGSGPDGYVTTLFPHQFSLAEDRSDRKKLELAGVWPDKLGAVCPDQGDAFATAEVLPQYATMPSGLTGCSQEDRTTTFKGIVKRIAREIAGGRRSGW